MIERLVVSCRGGIWSGAGTETFITIESNPQHSGTYGINGESSHLSTFIKSEGFDCLDYKRLMLPALGVMHAYGSIARFYRATSASAPLSFP